MHSSKTKVISIVLALFLFTGLLTVGCKRKTKNAWVNTASMPGQTFKKYESNNAEQNNSKVLYLGSDSSSQSENFGPRDVSFEFRDLK